MSVSGLVLLILIILVVLVAIIFYALFEMIVYNLKKKFNLLSQQTAQEQQPTHFQDRGDMHNEPSPGGQHQNVQPPPSSHPGQWEEESDSWSDQSTQTVPQNQGWDAQPSHWQTPQDRQMPQWGSPFRPPGNPFAPPPGQAREWNIDDVPDHEQTQPRDEGGFTEDPQPSQASPQYPPGSPAYSPPQSPHPPHQPPQQFIPQPQHQMYQPVPPNQSQYPQTASPRTEPKPPLGGPSPQYPGEYNRVQATTGQLPQTVEQRVDSPGELESSTPGQTFDSEPPTKIHEGSEETIRLPDAEELSADEKEKFVLDGQRVVKFETPRIAGGPQPQEPYNMGKSHDVHREGPIEKNEAEGPGFTQKESESGPERSVNEAPRGEEDQPTTPQGPPESQNNVIDEKTVDENPRKDPPVEEYQTDRSVDGEGS